MLWPTPMASPSRDGVVQRRQQAQSGRRIGSTSSSNSKGKGWSLSTRYSPHVGHTDCSLSPVTSNTSSWTNYLKDFVTQCKGLEEGRHSTRMTTPVTEQGMGLYQQFWAIKKRYVAVLLLVHHPAVGGNDRDLLSATTPASPRQHLPVR
jgi:hypothetical protein